MGEVLAEGLFVRVSRSKNLLLYRKCRRDMNICEWFTSFSPEKLAQKFVITSWNIWREKQTFKKSIHIDNSNYWEWEGDRSILPRSVLLNLNCFSQFSWGHFSVNRCYFIPGKKMAKCYLKQWTFQNGGDKFFAPIFQVKMMRITHEYSYLYGISYRTANFFIMTA